MWLTCWWRTIARGFSPRPAPQRQSHNGAMFQQPSLGKLPARMLKSMFPDVLSSLSDLARAACLPIWKTPILTKTRMGKRLASTLKQRHGLPSSLLRPFVLGNRAWKDPDSPHRTQRNIRAQGGPESPKVGQHPMSRADGEDNGLGLQFSPDSHLRHISQPKPSSYGLAALAQMAQTGKLHRAGQAKHRPTRRQHKCYAILSRKALRGMQPTCASLIKMRQETTQAKTAPAGIVWGVHQAGRNAWMLRLRNSLRQTTQAETCEAPVLCAALHITLSQNLAGITVSCPLSCFSRE